MQLNESGSKTYSGYIAIVGRPNVGKSTLLNDFLGQKISITSRKPQTTRHKILGVKTIGNRQAIFVDTPGIHMGEDRAINRYMNRAAKSALKDVDLVLFVVSGLTWTKEDELVLKLLSKVNKPVFLLINKIDQIKEPQNLLPHMEQLSKLRTFDEIFPISALKGEGIQKLEQKIMSALPEGPQYFPADQNTDQTLRFRVAELIREKLVRNLQAELPYSTTIEIEQFKEEERRYFISAIIWVERPGQKVIVIGKGGENLKKMGIQARREIEALLQKPVHLKLWVKVKASWSDDIRALKSLGYDL